MFRIPFCGRRQGRPLNTARKNAVDTVLPRLRVELPADGAPLDPAALLPGKTAYHLEIGFGGGEHLLSNAAAMPDVGFIGAEPFVNGYAALLTGLDSQNLDNVRLWPDDTRPLLAALKPGSLSMIYLMFSDPWPKARHAKRRVLQQETLTLFRRALGAGGHLRIATDDPTLQEWVAEQMQQRTNIVKDFRPILSGTATKPAWPETRYEQKALAAGRTPLYYEYEIL